MIAAEGGEREDRDDDDHHDERRPAASVHRRLAPRVLDEELFLGLVGADRLVLGAVILKHPVNLGRPAQERIEADDDAELRRAGDRLVAGRGDREVEVEEARHAFGGELRQEDEHPGLRTRAEAAAEAALLLRVGGRGCGRRCTLAVLGQHREEPSPARAPRATAASWQPRPRRSGLPRRGWPTTSTLGFRGSAPRPASPRRGRAARCAGPFRLRDHRPLAGRRAHSDLRVDKTIDSEPGERIITPSSTA